MKLTEEQAIDRSIDLWKWLAETGGEKEDWPGWSKYDRIASDCFLCEYDFGNRRITYCPQCHTCPYYEKYGYSCYDSGKPYSRWEDAVEDGEDTDIIKAHAKDFLLQLYELKHPTPTAPVEVKLKEISEELCGRKCAVCISCGAIYEDVPGIMMPCPNCNEEAEGLYFITLTHAWIGILKRHMK